MSYKTAKYITLWSKTGVFSKGMIDNTQNLYLNEWASPYLRNARLDWQSIIIRPWHTLAKELTAWSYPKGIGSYLQSTASNDRIVIRHNQDTTKKLVTLTEALVLAEIDTSTDIASDNKMTFLNIANVIYCMNWVDEFWKLSWTTYTTPATWIANFSPSFGVSFNGSHWASGWSDNPNIVYKSVADDYEDFSSAWSDTFTFQETITWLSANNQALFYFTNNTIAVTWTWDITDTAWTITYANRWLEVKEWAVNHYSIVEAWNRIFFLTPSNKINIVAKWQSIDWFEVMELSERKYAWISTIMSMLDKDQIDSFWYFLPKDNLIKWFLKSDWASFNDVCIIYDIIKDAFLVDWQKYFYDWLNFKWKNYTLSMIEAKVYQDEYGQDDEDSIIPFEYWTKEFYISEPTYKKIFRETRTLLDINELAWLQQEIYIDWWSKDLKTAYGDNITINIWWIWTDAIWENPIWESWEEPTMEEIYILRTKWNLNIRGRKIQFRFTNNTLAWKVRLKAISVKIEWLPGLTSNLTT